MVVKLGSSGLVTGFYFAMLPLLLLGAVGFVCLIAAGQAPDRMFVLAGGCTALALLSVFRIKVHMAKQRAVLTAPVTDSEGAPRLSRWRDSSITIGVVAGVAGLVLTSVSGYLPGLSGWSAAYPSVAPLIKAAAVALLVVVAALALVRRAGREKV
jgi:hypothetical protein